VFELAFADADYRIVQRKRLSRRMFAQALGHCGPLRVVMEACGSAHYCARRLSAQGHRVRLLPARDVRPYVRRNKTDRTDAAGLLEADRCAQINAVPIKWPEQQSVQALHRIREQLSVVRSPQGRIHDCNRLYSPAVLSPLSRDTCARSPYTNS
jgi:transposase